MTIHDELVRSLILKDGGKTWLEKILSLSWKDFKNVYFEYSTVVTNKEAEKIPICPDLVVYSTNKEAANKPDDLYIIEIESDKIWNFGESLRQVKKYLFTQSRWAKEVIVIIPKYYVNFAPMYLNEGFKVFVWEAISEWYCQRCGKTFDIKIDRNTQPRCSNKKCNAGKEEVELLKLKNVDISYPEYDKSILADYLKI
jgi:hypothetical protein